MSRSPLILPLLALLTACGGGIQGPKLEEPDTGTVEGPPNLFVETEFVDFGEVELQQVETYNLTVRNTGAGDLEITEPPHDTVSHLWIEHHPGGRQRGGQPDLPACSRLRRHADHPVQRRGGLGGEIQLRGRVISMPMTTATTASPQAATAVR